VEQCCIGGLQITISIHLLWIAESLLSIIADIFRIYILVLSVYIEWIDDGQE
jgi:hypothetical protein